MRGDDLPKLAAPALRALNGAGIKSLTQLARWSREEIAALHGMGPNAISRLQDALNARQLSFKKK